jgi:urease accessory protein
LRSAALVARCPSTPTLRATPRTAPSRLGHASASPAGVERPRSWNHHRSDERSAILHHLDSRLLQLADSAFPAGTFAHSFGFEALRQLGHLRTEPALLTRVREFAWNTGLSALPFLDAAAAGGAVAADRANEVFLSNHVANRASRAQGQAFLLAAEATLALPAITALREQLPFMHVAVAFGAALPFPLVEVRQLFLFGAVRGALSALVRLGALGPLRAQRLLYELHPHLDAVLEGTAGRRVEDATSVSPVLELCQGTHDRLYSRLFQS